MHSPPLTYKQSQQFILTWWTAWPGCLRTEPQSLWSELAARQPGPAGSRRTAAEIRSESHCVGGRRTDAQGKASHPRTSRTVGGWWPDSANLQGRGGGGGGNTQRQVWVCSCAAFCLFHFLPLTHRGGMYLSRFFWCLFYLLQLLQFELYNPWVFLFFLDNCLLLLPTFSHTKVYISTPYIGKHAC